MLYHGTACPALNVSFSLLITVNVKLAWKCSLPLLNIPRNECEQSLRSILLGLPNWNAYIAKYRLCMCVFICLFQYTPYDKPEECNLLGRWSRGSLFIVKKKKKRRTLESDIDLWLPCSGKKGTKKQLCNGGSFLWGVWWGYMFGWFHNLWTLQEPRIICKVVVLLHFLLRFFFFLRNHLFFLMQFVLSIIVS